MTNDLSQAKRLIQECLETKNTYLDLGNCGITNLDDLPELFECTHLETLILSNSWIELGNHRESQNKGVENKIEFITEKIQSLEVLKNLKIDINYHLKKLFTKDIYFLGYLSNLSSLSLRQNKISNYNFLENLSNLESLDLSFNEISDIGFLKKIGKLKNLDLSFNKISDISTLKDLRNLINLSLSFNNISDISVLKDLRNLTSLNFYNNQISDIRALNDLRNLTDLNFRNNNISKIPQFIFEMSVDIDDIIEGNPISNPPLEIIKQGKEAVLDWFEANKEKLNEIKIILVGEPEAGKTSLLKVLKQGVTAFNIKEKQTDGINIVDFNFSELDTFKNQKNLAGINAHFWDFGGQEIMNSTHRLFFTQRSIYILLLKARNDIKTENQVRDWTKSIIALGGNSPIIVVGNQIDINSGFDFVNEYSIKNDYKQIKAFLKISCNTGENIELLKDELAKIIPSSGFLNSSVDVRYLALKKKLIAETKKNDFVNQKLFLEICKEVGLNEKTAQHNAIEFLDELGIISHFPNIQSAIYYVLDPNWVTTGIYRIITSKLIVKNDGKLHKDDLEQILNIEKEKINDYKDILNTKIFTYEIAAERTFLLDVLQQHQLAIKIDENNLLIPNLLKGNPKDSVFEAFKDVAILEFHYEYLSIPKNLNTQLLVNIYKQFELETLWKNGCVAKRQNTKALIYTKQNELIIQIKGKDRIERRDLMVIIRDVMSKINTDLPIKPSLKIPLPNDERFVSVAELYEYLNNKEEYFTISNPFKKFKIRDLLDEFPINYDITDLIEGQKKTHNKLDGLEQTILSAITEIPNNLLPQLSKELIAVIGTAFELHQNDLNDEFHELYNKLNKTDDFSLKIKYSTQLLKTFTGLEIEAELDIKTLAEKIWTKYNYPLQKFLNYV